MDLFFCLIILILLVVLISSTSRVKRFNKTTYHLSTGNTYYQTFSDKGKLGEYQIYKQLNYLEKQGGKFLFNIYFPKEDGTTTECDVILITPRGFIVFESKNYSGWIFGDEKQKMWTQTLSQGQGKPALKERFFNPITQNNIHIKYLQSVVGSEYAVQSIIAFSERCELKKITISSPGVQVVKRNDILTAVNNAVNAMPQNAISQEEIDRLYLLLYPYSQVSNEVKQRHIQNITNKKLKLPLNE